MAQAGNDQWGDDEAFGFGGEGDARPNLYRTTCVGVVGTGVQPLGDDTLVTGL